jgi:class 3 adenylate cyclase/tetratricopeptide (TPR) repeat protein
MQCPKCETENLADSTFCVECGARLEPVCVACGAETPAGAKFCRRCGTQLDAEAPKPQAYTPEHLANKILSAKASTVGERKQVTVMFADVTGSMDLQEQLDPEDWRDVMDRFFHLMCDGVHRFEGTVNKFTGDGMMALFGAPIAHEDHAQRACYAALAISDKLGEYALELRRERGLNFHVRMGVNSGEVVFGAIGDDLTMDLTALGHTVGLAARMEGLAEPGAVYLTEHTASLIEGFFDVQDLGPFSVKGVSQPVKVFALKGLGSIRTRFDLSRARGFSRFVGRSAEEEAIEAALAAAMQGNGQIVGVVGEAGVGKSRLCHEFAERCSAKGISVRRAAGVAHGKSIPYLPVLELLRDYFNIIESESPQQSREKIAGKLLLLDRTLEDALPLLFEFLGIPDPDRPPPRMSPEARQRKLFAISRDIVHARSKKDVVVLILEDLHWIDSGSQVFLDALVDSLTGTTTLVLANFRPEYRAAWMDAPQYRGLSLEPLGIDETDELIRVLLGDDQSLEVLARQISERTAGNPFFIEEVVRTLAESGALEGTKGHYRLAHAVEDVAIPASVEAVLAARIDRLTDHQKAILQTASVIGREFSESVLEKVTEVDPTGLSDLLQSLVVSEFLYEAALYPEVEYAFKHPLTQEVAYHSQLGDRRVRVHAAVAHAILALYPEKLEERAALLAHHFEAAGQAFEAAQWRMAAAGWVGRSDHAEALEHLRRARASLESLPPGPVPDAMLLAVFAQVLFHGWRSGIDEAEAKDVYERGRALADASPDPQWVGLITGTYAGVRGVTGAIMEALDLSREAWESLGDSPEVAAPRLVLQVNFMYFQFVAGKWREALAVFEDVLSHPPDDPTLGIDLIGFSPYIWLAGMKGFVDAFSGRLSGAVERVQQAIDLAKAHGDLEVEGWMHGAMTGIGTILGDETVVGTHAERSLEIAEQIGSEFSRALAQQNMGLSLLHRGETKAAIEALETSLDISRKHKTLIEQTPYALALLSLAYLAEGDARGLSTAKEAVAEAERMGTGGTRPRAQIALALAQLRLGGPDGMEAARKLLDEAESATHEMGSLGWAPDIQLARAEIAEAAGDEDGKRAALQEAHRLYEEIGARAAAAKLSAQLS